MNQIPWYRSPVFTIGLTAFLTHAATTVDEEFLVQLLAREPRAVARAIGVVLSAAVVGFRAASTVQPLTLTAKKDE